VDGLCGIVGRRQVVRVARFALHRARFDVPNDPRRNGEFALQRWLLDAIPAATPLTAYDVGAHVGRWSRNLIELTHHTGHALQLHAFEPAPETYRLLSADLPETVRVNQLAVSDLPGELTLHMVGPLAGRNSLHRQDDATAQQRVAATTIDEYTVRTGVDRIDLLKVDAEGHDYRVLRGAESMFGQGAVSLVQFEYNHRWVYSRHFLKDAFDLLEPLGYQLGKLTRHGVEWYRAWDADLETFIEGNYVACKPQLGRRLPAIRWWKE
jgi:FkbM family methyltransferase